MGKTHSADKIMDLINSMKFNQGQISALEKVNQIDDSIQKSPILSNISIDGSSERKPHHLGMINPNDNEKPFLRDRSMSSYGTDKSMQSANSMGTMGSPSRSGSYDSLGSGYSQEDKRLKVLKFWEKKKQRMNRNHVRYHCRKDLAQNRFRYHGRFISKEQM